MCGNWHCGVNQTPLPIHHECPDVTLSNSFSADPSTTNTTLHPCGRSNTWSSMTTWIRGASPLRDHLNSYHVHLIQGFINKCRLYTWSSVSHLSSSHWWLSYSTVNTAWCSGHPRKWLIGSLQFNVALGLCRNKPKDPRLPILKNCMFTVKFFYKLKKKNLAIICNEVHSLSLDLKKVRE